MTLTFSLATPHSVFAQNNGERVDIKKYRNRAMLPDPNSTDCSKVKSALTQISGALYRHTIGSPTSYSGLVLITSKGALVVDPTQTCAAIILREGIKKRFNVKVKYVIYTHAHFDHIGGGQIFQDDGALVVAHKSAIEPIVGEKLPTAIPNRIFDERMTIELGGETIELFRVAPSHSNSMTLVYFPKYKALQCTDICGSDSLPFNDFPDFYYEGWIKTLKWVQSLEIEWVDDGHHPLATKKQQANLLTYIEDLHVQILNLVRKGQSWDEVYRNVKFKEEYKKWSGFETKKYLNVLGMYRWVTTHRRGLW